jgi:hypothetical protein
LVKPAALLARIVGGAVGNVSLSDLVRLLTALGFREAGGRGSHRIIVHPRVTELINLQEEQGQAKTYQVRQVVTLIQRYDLVLEEEP